MSKKIILQESIIHGSSCELIKYFKTKCFFFHVEIYLPISSQYR